LKGIALYYAFKNSIEETPFPPIPSIAADAQALQLWQNASTLNLSSESSSETKKVALSTSLFANILLISLGALLSIGSNVHAAGTRLISF